MTNRWSTLRSALAAIGAMSLAACSGSDKGSQDVGSGGGTHSRTFSARVVDGHLAGATVYVDQNANGKLDAFEPRALTDSDGYFSYNHVKGVDYCAANAPAAHASYCLRGAIAPDAQVLIRATGGYDTVTGLPFKGVLSLRSSELDSGDLRLVTPQTSMMADLPSSQVGGAVQALMDAGLLKANGIFDSDHIDGLDYDAAARAQLAAILARTFSEGASAVAPSYQDLGGAGWAAGYIAMAQKMRDSTLGSIGLGGHFGSTNDVMEGLRRFAYALSNPGEPMPPGFTLLNEAAALPLLEAIAAVAGLTEELIQALPSGAATSEHLRAMLRIQAVAAERAFANPSDPEIPDLLAWARNQLAQGNGLGSDLTALGADDVDLSVLIDRNFDFDPASNSISTSATIPAAAARAFESLVNTAFSVSVDKGDEQGAALFYVTGENGARSGALDVCVRYRDDSGDFDTGSATDPNGAMRVKGGWSLLNDHSLVLSIEIVGGVRSMLLKSVGVNGIDQRYRFDFGGDLTEWTGTAPSGFTVGSAPKSDADCKAALIDAFGSVT